MDISAWIWSSHCELKMTCHVLSLANQSCPNMLGSGWDDQNCTVFPTPNQFPQTGAARTTKYGSFGKPKRKSRTMLSPHATCASGGGKVVERSEYFASGIGEHFWRSLLAVLMGAAPVLATRKRSNRPPEDPGGPCRAWIESVMGSLTHF